MNAIYNEVYENLGRLQWLMHRQHGGAGMENGRAFANRTRGQGRVLAMLKIQPDISSRDLAYLLGIRQQSLNELLNKLEKSGFITRSPSDGDRRVIMIHLTDAGRAVQQEEKEENGVLACLNDEELAAFNEYIVRIIKALEEQTGGDADNDEWMNNARERMGVEQFDRLMEMRGGFGRGFGHGPHGRGGFGEDGHRGPHGRGEFGEDGYRGSHGRGEFGECDQRGPHGRGEFGEDGHRGPHGRGEFGECDQRGPHGRGGFGEDGHHGPHGRGEFGEDGYRGSHGRGEFGEDGQRSPTKRGGCPRRMGAEVGISEDGICQGCGKHCNIGKDVSTER